VDVLRQFTPELGWHVRAWPETGTLRGLIVAPWPEDMRDDRWLPYINDSGHMPESIKFWRDADLLDALARTLRDLGDPRLAWIRLERTCEPMGGLPPDWPARMPRRYRELQAALDRYGLRHPRIIVHRWRVAPTTFVP